MSALSVVTQVLATQAGHQVQVEEPELVANSILSVVHGEIGPGRMYWGLTTVLQSGLGSSSSLIVDCVAAEAPSALTLLDALLAPGEVVLSAGRSSDRDARID
jgi:hypothetical protein